MICMHLRLTVYTVEPPNTAALGTGKKRQFWKTAVKGVIYNQEKTYLGRYWGGGGGGQQRGGIGWG